MKPFDAPANANTPVTAAPFWLHLPLVSYAAAMDMATYQMRCWMAVQEAALDLTQTAWRAGKPADAPQTDPSPILGAVAADVRAMLQASTDALEALRHSA